MAMSWRLFQRLQVAKKREMEIPMSEQPLTQEQLPENLQRYHRQTLLPGFGVEGQQKLLNSRVLVVGCGALGTVIVNMLARAGVGEIIVADRDFIEVTNLQRQVLFDESDVTNAIPKAEAARQKIAKIRIICSQFFQCLSDGCSFNFQLLLITDLWT